LVLYLSRTAHPEIVNLIPDPNGSGRFLAAEEPQCALLKIIRIDGSLFFGAVNHIAEHLQGIDKNADYKRLLLIVACGINFIDVAGAEMLAHEAVRRRKLRGDLYLCALKQQARDVLERGGYMDIIGEDHVFSSELEAIKTILSKADESECMRCQSHLFVECKPALDESVSPESAGGQGHPARS
jgi:SulP family sulfate permease